MTFAPVSRQAVAAVHMSPNGNLPGNSVIFGGRSNGPQIFPPVRTVSIDDVKKNCSRGASQQVVSSLTFSNDPNTSNPRNILNWHLAPSRKVGTALETMALAEAVASFRMTGSGSKYGDTRWDTGSGFNYTFFPCTRCTTFRDVNTQRVDVVSYFVLYSSHIPTQMYEDMGIDSDHVQYTLRSTASITVNVDMRLVGDINARESIASAIETVQPQNGWWISIFPAVDPALVQQSMERAMQNYYINKTTPAGGDWQERPGEKIATSKRMLPRDEESYKQWRTEFWRISGDSLGLAVAAAIAGCPSIHYTGYFSEFGRNARLAASGNAFANKQFIETLPQGGLVDSVDNVAWKALYCAVNNLPICIPLTAANRMSIQQLISAAANGIGDAGTLPSARNALFIQIAARAYSVDMGQEGYDYLSGATPVMFVKTLSDVFHLSNLAAAAYLWGSATIAEKADDFADILDESAGGPDGQTVGELLSQRRLQVQDNRRKAAGGPQGTKALAKARRSGDTQAATAIMKARADAAYARTQKAKTARMQEEMKKSGAVRAGKVQRIPAVLAGTYQAPPSSRAKYLQAANFTPTITKKAMKEGLSYMTQKSKARTYTKKDGTVVNVKGYPDGRKLSYAITSKLNPWDDYRAARVPKAQAAHAKGMAALKAYRLAHPYEHKTGPVTAHQIKGAQTILANPGKYKPGHLTAARNIMARSQGGQPASRSSSAASAASATPSGRSRTVTFGPFSSGRTPSRSAVRDDVEVSSDTDEEDDFGYQPLVDDEPYESVVARRGKYVPPEVETEVSAPRKSLSAAPPRPSARPSAARDIPDLPRAPPSRSASAAASRAASSAPAGSQSRPRGSMSMPGERQGSVSREIGVSAGGKFGRGYQAGGFFDDLWGGIKDVGKTVGQIGLGVAKQVGGRALDRGIAGLMGADGKFRRR